MFSIFFFLVNYQVNFLLFSFSLVVFDCRAPPAPPGEDSCSAAQGVERMSSAMRVDRRTEVVVNSGASLHLVASNWIAALGFGDGGGERAQTMSFCFRGILSSFP